MSLETLCKMNTTRYTESLGQFFNFGYKFGLIPFQWSEKRKEFEKLTRNHIKLCRMITLLTFSRGIHLFLNLLYGICITNRPARTLLMDLFWVLIALEAGFMHCFFWMNLRSFPLHLNALAEFPVRRDSDHSPSSTQTKMTLLLENLPRLSIKLIIFNSFALSATFIFATKNTRSIYNLFPAELRSVLTFSVCSFLEVMTMLIVAYTWHLGLFLSIFYVLILLSSLQSLQKGTQMGAGTTLTTWEQAAIRANIFEKVKTYKQLSILHIRAYNTCFYPIVAKLMLSIMYCYLITLFATVRLHDSLPPATLAIYAYWSFLVSPVLVSCYFLQTAFVYENSREIIQSWSGHLKFRERRRMRLAPIRIRFGGTVRRNTPLLVILVVCKTAKYIFIAC